MAAATVGSSGPLRNLMPSAAKALTPLDLQSTVPFLADVLRHVYVGINTPKNFARLAIKTSDDIFYSDLPPWYRNLSIIKDSLTSIDLIDDAIKRGENFNVSETLKAFADTDCDGSDFPSDRGKKTQFHIVWLHEGLIPNAGIHDNLPIMKIQNPELFSVTTLEELRDYFLEHRVRKALLGYPYTQDCLETVSDAGLKALQTTLKRYPNYVPDELRGYLREDAEQETGRRFEQEKARAARCEKDRMDYEIHRAEPAHYSWNFHSEDWRVPSCFNETTIHLKTYKAFDLS